MPLAREKTPHSASPTSRRAQPLGRSNRLASFMREHFPELTPEGIDLVINVTQQLVALGDAFARLQETMQALWSVWKPQIEQDLRAQPRRSTAVRFNLRSARQPDSEYDSEASDGMYAHAWHVASLAASPPACKPSKVRRRMAARHLPRLSGPRTSRRTRTESTRRARRSAEGCR